MNNQTIIEIKDVVKIYKRGEEEVHAVDGIGLEIKKGEFLSVVGPSGSGKTTLLNIIGCVDNPTQGTVKINGQDVTTVKEARLTKIRRDAIGFVFQQFFLIPTLTALENVQLPGLFAKNINRVKQAEELLNLVGLNKRIHHRPAHLSGGEMQRVAIARSLINSPSVLLADEPTGNLDSKNAEMIFKIFDELNKNGLTVIVVTHNMELAKNCRKVILLEDGKIKNA
ncbi:ABC transporter ATP-binding protein [bacterium Unc6]|nr:ABC transporter ATP-binding protein [bacterium Unc6]MBT9129972.1 putative ABC transporter ATP-binding protein YknY [Candidatus Psychracetigena formicireducens]